MTHSERHAIVQLIAELPNDPRVRCACGWVWYLPDPEDHNAVNALLDTYNLHARGYKPVIQPKPPRPEPPAEAAD